MRPVPSSRRRHASAQRRDPQSKLGSLNAEQRLAFDVLPIKQFAAHRSERCSRIRRQPGPYDLARVPRFMIFAMARRALGERADSMLRMRSIYAQSLYLDATGATLDDVRESVETLEDTERTARRVLSGAHPLVVDIGDEYRDAQAAFCARETLRPRTTTSPSPKPASHGRCRRTISLYSPRNALAATV